MINKLSCVDNVLELSSVSKRLHLTFALYKVGSALDSIKGLIPNEVKIDGSLHTPMRPYELYEVGSTINYINGPIPSVINIEGTLETPSRYYPPL